MAVKLEVPAEEVVPSAGDYAPMLDKLQANILKPHGRNHARHIFLKFTGTPDTVKKWIRQAIAPGVTTAGQQFIASEADTDDKKVDGGPVMGFFLSAKGYKYLGLKTTAFASEAFRNGMKDQSDALLDPLFDRDNKDPAVKDWETWSQQEIHALITVADAKKENVEAEAKKVRDGAAAVASVLTTEIGTVLRRKVEGKPADQGAPVEHFGYLDGISQPVFTLPDLKKKQKKNKEGSKWDPSAPLSLVLVPDPLTADSDAFGSYLVYRKLGQDLDRFAKTVTALAAALGVTEDLAGALAIGRFKDGSPVVMQDHPGKGAVNDFNFRDDDRDGARCPMHSHIRKANPRGTTPLTSPANEKKRRIARRGIPYGAPISTAVADFPDSDPNPSLERGLLFLCFQANIDEQFEFIQRTWVDNEFFPRGLILQKDTGDDPLIGQDDDEAQRWPNKWGDKKAGKKTFNFDSAVRLKGGEYFFAPSLTFLRSV